MKTMREEGFCSLSLEIKNKSSLGEALDEMVKGEMLEGDNAYKWDDINKKLPTLKRQSLKSLPPFLVITMKRFIFDFETCQ